ncbi:MAG: hypothetical protein H7Z41_12235 [Cytophagales bacterium]|nr:hypothetical protein [Armatimonadota bacterium]
MLTLSFPRRALVTGLLLALLGAAGSAALRAQAVSKVSRASKMSAAPRAPLTPKGRKVTVSMDSYSDITATGIRTLLGNVRIISGATLMRTALAQYNYNTNVAVAPGKIQIEDERNTLVGNSGTAFYQTRDAIIRGAVKIVVRPKAGSAAAPEGSVRREFKDPVMVFCDRVDYNWRTRIAVATGNLTLKQNTSDGITRTATAKKLIFYAREERLLLQGDVNAVDSKGQKLKGPEATAIIREGAEEFRMERGANAEILIEDEDEPDAPTLPAAPTQSVPPLILPPVSPAAPAVPGPAPVVPGP